MNTDTLWDFMQFITKKDWNGGYSIIEKLGDSGFENEALMLHQILNRAKAADEYVWIPVESHIPFISPEEDDAPLTKGEPEFNEGLEEEELKFQARRAGA